MYANLASGALMVIGAVFQRPRLRHAAVAMPDHAAGVMDGHDQLEVQFRLSAATVPSAEILLRSRGGRWQAAADLHGRRAVGIGASPRQALTASLTPFGARTASALLADPALFAVSTAVAGRQRDAATVVMGKHRE